MAVPSMYDKMIEYAVEKGLSPENMRHIRLWASGSAPLLAKDFERIVKYMGKEPVETAATFHDGWFRTGDLGKVLKDEVRLLFSKT